MRTLNINYIIYFYMFICLTLLFFNIAYIFLYEDQAVCAGWSIQALED